MGNVIDFARKLGELLDVPLVVCEPSSGKPEFHYPKGVRDKIPSAQNDLRLAQRKPGKAIMGAMGGKVAVGDVDPRNGGDVARMRQMLDGLGVRVYAEVETPGPGEGRHFCVAGHPELVSVRSPTGWPGIDVLSFGSLVFLPGTQRPKWGGAGYKIVFDNLEALADGGDPDGGAALAGWVAERHGNREDFELAPLWNGEALSRRQAAYLRAMIKNMHCELSITGKGGRNTAVYNAALKIGNFIAGAGLDEAHATAMLLDACYHNGLITEDGEYSVMASIQSGIRNGKAQPRAVPEPERSANLQADSPEGFVSDEGQYLDLEPITKTDDGNALRLISAHGDKFRRVADMHRWFHWDDARWATDHDERKIREAARELARSLPEDDKGDSFKRVSMSATGISSAVRLAQSDPRVSILAVDLDSHPELINTPSGVVDLRTGTIMPHNPALLLTRLTAQPVDLDKSHLRWDEFLAETFDKDAELINYMQRLCGLALLGDVRDHVLPFLHGVGANGKGVLTLVLQGLLGDAGAGGYAVSAPDGFLMTGREGKHETEIARLRGARLVVCAEQTSGKRFDESKVKRLTGGDMLTGRFMRGDFFDFPPSHLVWVLSNHLPAVREGGPSFWRRVRRIPFRHVVPEDHRIRRENLWAHWPR
jgi:P4 family phage/plasmid primase-like protien